MSRFPRRSRRDLPDPGSRRAAKRRPDPMAWLRSVAGQMFVLQFLIALLLVAVVATTLLFKERADKIEAAREHSLAAAEAFAHGPGLVDTLRGSDPTAVLQPLTEAVRAQAAVDFVTVMDRDGIRYTSPKTDLIGKKFHGDIGPPQNGRAITEVDTSPFGDEVQAIVPVTDAGGTVVGMVASGVTVRHVSSAVLQDVPIMLGAGAVALGLSTAGTAWVSRRLRRQTHGLGPAEMTRMYEHHDAVLHSVREGVIIVDGDGRVLMANDEARRLLDLPRTVEGLPVGGLGLPPRLADLLRFRRATSDEVVPVGGRQLVVNSRRTDRAGGPPGGVATLRDSTELHLLSEKVELGRQRLRLLYEASTGIGTTLDVRRTAQELADVARRFADCVTVDLAEPVLSGEEPQPGGEGEAPELLRVAASCQEDGRPLDRVDELHACPATTPTAESFATGRSVLVKDVRTSPHALSSDESVTRRALGHGLHSVITVPLSARGVLMGVAAFWRTGDSAPLDEDDLSLAEELSARAAVCIDNARRFTREHAMAVALQRSLLPRGLPDQRALEVAHRYLPAPGGVSGDWFDVIPLPGARVALVVGDVVGHGLHAAATMGRLRTAVQNFATLDLPPDELLGHLDELAARIDQETAAADRQPKVAGATCLYAVYDSTTGTCAVATAGHPAPALVLPDGTTDFPGLTTGPPLGVDGIPFEAAELSVPEGSSLVLFTDGLLRHPAHDVDARLALLHTTLARPGRAPEDTCTAVLDALVPDRQDDDIALLVARTRTLPADRIAQWEVPPDLAAVADSRNRALRKLREWSLDELEFTTELVLSELVTNAIRYASAPILVRLIHGNRLTCEVHDASSTSPHLRYAAMEDEGGRGLFLVAQLTAHWGTRYTPTGKIIWAEQEVPGNPAGS
ncbi:SpoIIE family protein phosphatase [Streptoverticillium reticulum]|uniref:SpoIIE family protein phosphatase n=1 Tax=Streptoverticillium reticulum TaxID=1433415 RepID=UPI0039BF46A1